MCICFLDNGEPSFSLLWDSHLGLGKLNMEPDMTSALMTILRGAEGGREPTKLRSRVLTLGKNR